MTTAEKKLLNDSRESAIALRNKLTNAENLMRQKALQDEDVLKAVGLYDYLDNRDGYSLEHFLDVQLLLAETDDNIMQLSEKIKEYKNLPREEKISAFEYLHKSVDTFARAVKDYCVYQMLKG